MKPIRTLALVALVQLTCASASIAKESPGDRAILGIYSSAVLNFEQGEPELAFEDLKQALEPEIFGDLSPGRKYDVARLYAEAARRIGEWPEAHRGFVLATANTRAEDYDWHYRLFTALMAGENEDAYTAFKRLQKTGQPVVSPLGDVDRLDQALRSLPDPQARLDLGRQLEREDWRPNYAHIDPSLIWLHYVEALMEAGDQKAAISASRNITSPMVIMAMQADRRFDPIVAANPALQDAQAAADRYLAVTHAYMAQNPRYLAGRLAVVRALTILGRNQEALQLLEDTSATLSAAPRRNPPFDDMELVAGLQTYRTSALMSVGRVDEGIGGRIAEATCHCSRTAPISVARAMLNVGRPQEAQRWIQEAPTAGLDNHWRMEKARVGACVAAELKDQAGFDRELAYLKANERAMPEALADALLCAGRVDEAAATVARQIADPRTRLGLLSRLQTYASDGPIEPYEATMLARWASLAQAPAVKTEVERVGRLNRFKLVQWESMS